MLLYVIVCINVCYKGTLCFPLLLCSAGQNLPQILFQTADFVIISEIANKAPIYIRAVIRFRVGEPSRQSFL